jgi:hypothetical protein
MSFNIEFKKNGNAEGYLKCGPEGGGQIHIEGCPNRESEAIYDWDCTYHDECECPFEYLDNTKAIMPFDCKLIGISLVARTPSDAEAVIEFEGCKKVAMAYDNHRQKSLRFETLNVANPKKGHEVKVRLTKPTKDPLVNLMFEAD